MDWKSMKFLMASSVTVAVVSHVVHKIYKKYKKPRNLNEIKERFFRDFKHKQYAYCNEFSDVLMFSDLSTKCVKPLPARNKSNINKYRNNRDKLFKYIQSARETLDVCMYLITSGEIAEEIIRLGERSVTVRILVDGDMAFTGGSQVKILSQYCFIKVQCHKASNLMHHKFCIVDGPTAIKRKNKLRRCAQRLHQGIECDNDNKEFNAYSPSVKSKTNGFVMSGSLNWTTQALNGNWDNVVVISQPSVVQKFEREFAKMWMDNEAVAANTFKKKALTAD